jgi:glycolate oxidase
MSQPAEDARTAFLTLHEVVKAARAKLDPNMWDYVVGGTETETTVARNRLAIDSVAFRPRVLRDVSRIDPSWPFFGKPIRLPVILAPVGGLDNIEKGGGASAGKGASEFGVPLMLSSVSGPGLEATAAATPGPKVFQLYVRGPDEFIDDHARRAIDAGYDAFCLTVDTAIYSRRERDIARRFAKPWRATATDVGQRYQAALSWREVARFKEMFPGIPLVLKGIATAEDAQEAVRHGVEVVYVSNHGGRQLDHGRGSLDVMPEVIEAVAGKAKVWVDGGFSRGTDVVKAIGLGADLVGLGRLYCYGLAAAGAAGVTRVLEILENEVISCLGLLGVTRFAEIGPGHLHRGAPVVATPHVHSAFPLLKDY